MTIDFYCCMASPGCRSVLLLAKALRVEFNMKITIAGNYEMIRSQEFLKINPQHCIPTIVDNGFSLWESRAILAYLANKYAKEDSIYPKDPQKRAMVDQRLYFDIGTFYPAITGIISPLGKGKDPAAEAVVKLKEAFQLLDKFLEGQDWVAGSNITIADYAIAVSISMMELFKYDIGTYSNVSKWMSRIKKAMPEFDEMQKTGNEEIKALQNKNLKR